VALLDRDGVPEHIRALTSANVLQIENDLVGRLAVRGAQSGHDLAGSAVAAAAERSRARLNAGQAAAVATLAGDRPLLVVEGAAGAGKTTLLRVTRSFVTEQGHRLNVVTPTLKAAQAATVEVRTRASSAAKLAHGFRWDADGTWTRLAVGDTDPKTGRVHAGPGDRMRLEQGDLLLADEAGMLDQDTARALLTVADEAGARIALVGDRHQLAAVGRGGELDQAARWADVVACRRHPPLHP
jgi:exodeoxyribonuclease V alpha subunit